jgi:hypothetical protein
VAGTGAGMIVWYPRVTEGPSLFYYKCDLSNKLPEGATGIPFVVGATPALLDTLDSSKWRLGFSRAYADNF